jgi:hypothetical protein
VVLDVEQSDGGKRVAVERAVYARGSIAARNIGNKLHGYELTEWRTVRDGFVRMRLHAEVCEFVDPPTEQLPLFPTTTQEGDT